MPDRVCYATFKEGSKEMHGVMVGVVRLLIVSVGPMYELLVNIISSKSMFLIKSISIPVTNSYSHTSTIEVPFYL